MASTAAGALHVADGISWLRCLERLALVNCQVSRVWALRSALDVILLSVSLSHPVPAAYCAAA